MPEDFFNADDLDKRSTSEPKLRRRSYIGEKLREGDQPWYCFWNSTVEEFWIFLDKNVSTSTTTLASAAAAVTGSPQKMSDYDAGTFVTPEKLTSPTTATEVYAEGIALPDPTTAAWDLPKIRRKRDATSLPTTATHPKFPKLIKMVEKRKPHSNVAPYCQQMKVMTNWLVVPLETPTIPIEEKEYSMPPPNKKRQEQNWGWSKKTDVLARRDDIIGQLESMCICEWRSKGQG